MIGFLRALGNGIFIFFAAASSLGMGALLLWWVATSEITGMGALVIVPVGIVMVLSGIGFTAMVGDAMEKWNG